MHNNALHKHVDTFNNLKRKKTAVIRNSTKYMYTLSADDNADAVGATKTMT